jgi:hypothetical protein
MSGVTDGSGVFVGVGVRVKVGRGTRVEVGVDAGLVAAVGVGVAAVSVGVISEVPHATNNSRHAQMPRIKGNRVLFMPSVYNGFRACFSTLARRLSRDYSPRGNLGQK